ERVASRSPGALILTASRCRAAGVLNPAGVLIPNTAPPDLLILICSAPWLTGSVTLDWPIVTTSGFAFVSVAVALTPGRRDCAATGGIVGQSSAYATTPGMDDGN